MAELLSKDTGTETPLSKTPHDMNVFEEMERLFEDFSPRSWMHPFRSRFPLLSEMSASFETNPPKVDVINRDKEIVIKAMMPGVDKKDIKVSVTRNTVTISGNTSHEEKEEKGDYYRCEISKGSYKRTMVLPEDVDEEKAKAKFKDGMLKLTIPKKEASHRKSVEVD